MTILSITLRAGLLVTLVSPAAAYADQPRSVTQGASTALPVAVRENGLVATWFPPASGKKGPAVLVLGGSEGGEDGGKYLGRAVAREGYGVLSLAYFGADGLPANLQEVPLEYFDRALAWLAAQPLVDARRIGIYGISVGGETALLVASRHPRIKAVIAAVPSSVVWQGINMRDFTSVKSTYSLDGKPVTYVPYDNSAPFTSILDMYQRSLARPDLPAGAIIPVERIGGSILLLSSKDDRLWPSTMMSDQIVKRLDAAGFKQPHVHIAYDDAGHGAMTPPSGDPAMAALNNLGGTVAGNKAARMDMWPRVTEFLATSLGSTDRKGRK